MISGSGHKRLCQNKAGGLTRGRWAQKRGRPTRQAGREGRWANKRGGLTRQVGLQSRWAYKAGGQTRQVGRQGRQAYKPCRPTRQAGLQGRWTEKTGRLTRQADLHVKSGLPVQSMCPLLLTIFFAATDRTNKTKQDRLLRQKTVKYKLSIFFTITAKGVKVSNQ